MLSARSASACLKRGGEDYYRPTVASCSPQTSGNLLCALINGHPKLPVDNTPPPPTLQQQPQHLIVLIGVLYGIALAAACLPLEANYCQEV